MARAASSRCSSIFSRLSVSSQFSSLALVHSTPITSPPIITTSQLAALPLTCHADPRRHCSFHQNSFSSAREFSSESGVTIQDPLVDKIVQVENVEELFHILSTNKARFSENHIATTFYALLSLRRKANDQGVFSEMVRLRPEFQTLSDLAENRASTFEDVLLVNMLYCSLKLLTDHGHSLIRELRNECLCRVDQFETAQLSKLAACLTDLGETRGRSMGRVVNAYSHILDKTKHVKELSTFMKECKSLLSQDFKARVIKELNIFLDSKDLGYGEATGRHHRKVFMCIQKFTNNYQSILDKCSRHILCDLDSISTREVCIMISCLANLRYDNPGLLELLKGMLYEQLTTLTDPIDMALSTELLGFDAPAHIKLQLVENAMKMVDKLPVRYVGHLCSGLRRMGYLSRSPLHDKIREKLWTHSSELTIDTLMPVVQYHTKLAWMTAELWQPFESRLYQLTMDQIHTMSFHAGFYTLLLIPTFCPDDKLLEKTLRMLPHISNVGTLILFRAMKRMMQRTAGDGKIGDMGKDVLRAIRIQAMESLHRATSAEYIFPLMDSVLEEGGDMELIDALFGRLAQIPQRISPLQAVVCARSMHRMRYFSKELLDCIMEITVPVIEKVTPIQVLYLISPYCTLNYQPKHSEAFFDACINRVVPFVDDLPTGFLVDIAYTMSYNQQFPEEILRRIFSLEFLTKLDEDLEGMPDRCDMYRRKLMLLNRAVALECPELQVPWFHDEYCQDLLKKKREPFYHPSIHEIQKNLVEVLGGAQYLRSLVTTPYYYQINFECILDASGTPLTCANYGSGLNHSKGLSGSVLSDLMQWDTERKQLPEGAQRVAIDYVYRNMYCINSARLLGMATLKKRHLELLGYHYVQIPFFEWQSLALTGREEKEEYLRMKIFASSNQKLPDIATAPQRFLHYGRKSSFAPSFDQRKRKDMIGDALDLDLSDDRIT